MEAKSEFLKQMDIQRQVTQLAKTSAARSLGSQSLQTELSRPRKRQRNLGPVLPINTNRLSFPIPSSKLHVNLKTNWIQKCTPWITYHKFMMLEQGGSALICHDQRHSLVAIKDRPHKKEDMLDCLTSCLYGNLVNLVDVFFNNNTVYLAYEYVEISARNLRSNSKRILNHVQIAAICKEVRSDLVSFAPRKIN